MSETCILKSFELRQLYVLLCLGDLIIFAIKSGTRKILKYFCKTFFLSFMEVYGLCSVYFNFKCLYTKNHLTIFVFIGIFADQVDDDLVLAYLLIHCVGFLNLL